MKLRKILIAGALALSSMTLSAQIKMPDEFTRAEIDSTSYLLGVNFGAFIRSNGFNPIDYQKMNSGIDDFVSAIGDPNDVETIVSQLKFDPRDMNECFANYLEAETHSADETEKASYLLGVNFGAFIRSYDFPEPDYTTLLIGINDLLTADGTVDEAEFNSHFKYSPDLMNEVFNRVIMKNMDIKLQKNIYEGEVFMAQNAKAKGVKTTESGLQYKIIKKGKSKTHPDEDSDVELLYKGSLLDGTVFDETGDKSRTFPLGNLIQAWQEGLPFIGEGGHIILYAPYNLGYGERGTGPIGPGAFLVFDIQLLKVS